nr:hypothetical protein [uncultured Cohaesibacter sp.]
MSGRKLYIHIGSHKTGTTSIQHALKENKEALGRKGLVFFYQKQNGTWNGFPDLHDWIEYVHKGRIVPQGARLSNGKNLLARFAEFEQDVIVSSENFSFFFERQNIEEIKTILSRQFDQIEIICYLRRQDQHAISHAQEGSKDQRHAEYDLWGNHSDILPPYDPRFDLYLDYNRRIGMWIDVFGEGAVKVRCFDRSRLVGNDAVADFFSILGVSDYVGGSRRNETKTALQTKLGHLLIGSSALNKGKLFTLINSLALPEQEMQPSRHQAEQFYSHYQESNLALSERLGVSDFPEFFSTDFSSYPEQSSDCWDRETVEGLLQALFSELGDNYLRLTLNDLLTAAALNKDLGNYSESFRFLRFAKALQPNSPRVQKEIADVRRLAQNMTNA